MYEYKGHLIQEDVRNIDPYSSDLTPEDKRKVVRECRLNFKYYINAILSKNKEDSLLHKIYITVIGE